MGMNVKHTRTIEMTCDICNKQETINPDVDRNKILDWHIRHWMELDVIEPFANIYPPEMKRKIYLCPKCKRKFKKLIMNTELNEEE